MTTDSVAPGTVKTPTTDIPAVVARLRETFKTGRTRSLDWRKQQLQALEKMMVENEETIAAALADDLDRSPFEAWLADSAATAAEARYAYKNVGKWPRLGRIRAVRHGADHRRMELPPLSDAWARRRRHRGG